MAVENKYINADVVAGSSASAVKASGSDLSVMVSTFEIAATDDDGSVFRIAKALPGNLVPVRIDVLCDAITAGTDFDLGFYKTDLGAVIDKDALMDGQTLATATHVSAPLNGLGAVDRANLGKKIYELAGHTLKTREGAYDLALTGNTVGTAAGTVTVVAYFAQG
jgi:hypothetical protein